jgi:hypothetical protein
MNKLRTVLLVLGALGVGAVAGGWGVSRFSRHIAIGSLSDMMAAQVSATVLTLERIRKGDTAGAIELQEAGLDGQLCALADTMPDARQTVFHSMKLECIQEARDYRARFPRTNSPPHTAEGVARAFRLLDGESRR